MLPAIRVYYLDTNYAWMAVMVVRKWATRGLSAGDLTALRSLARGGSAAEPQITRLKKRGFIKDTVNEKHPSLTLPGRLALIIKRVTIH